MLRLFALLLPGARQVGPEEAEQDPRIDDVQCAFTGLVSMGLCPIPRTRFVAAPALTTLRAGSTRKGAGVSLSSRAVNTLVELIAKKRDGGRLSDEDIQRVIAALGAGELADYQMSALLVAVFFRGMDDAETVALTRAMLHSGDVLDLSAVPGVKVDKHSTGGVGDKVSICLAPLVAACGVPVPMVSGRGLGHTGGTLDKLEAIPGFSVQLDTEAFRRIVADVGTCMIGQTSRIAPADKRIYALRDVTATVESIPLIVASILSKKLAEGIDALVLDVKVGRGAFTKTERDARALAEALVRVGTAAGKQVTALLTDMSAPLGRTVGNAIETREAIDVLHGRGPADLVECTLALGAEMLRLGRVAGSDEEARAALKQAIASGKAAQTMERMIEAQGGDPASSPTPACSLRPPSRWRSSPSAAASSPPSIRWRSASAPWRWAQAARAPIRRSTRSSASSSPSAAAKRSRPALPRPPPRPPRRRRRRRARPRPRRVPDRRRGGGDPGAGAGADRLARWLVSNDTSHGAVGDFRRAGCAA